MIGNAIKGQMMIIKFKLIVYLEDDIKEQIIKNKLFNENIVFVNLDKVDTFYKKYLNKDKEIMGSKEYQTKIPYDRKTNPEHVYSEYNMINHSKINFVCYTKDLYPDYDFYAWIDFGSVNCNVENIPKSINFNLLEPRIIYQCIKNPPNERLDANKMLASHNIYFTGCYFIIYKDMVNRFDKLYENKIIEWQESGITDDDQNLVLQIYYDSPELFQIVKHPEWFKMFLVLQP